MTFDLEAAVRREQKREAQEREEARAAWAAARSAAESLASEMAASCGDGLEAVVLFGSVARGEPRPAACPDIDLALSATPEAYLRAVSLALRSPFAVDVIDLSTADERFRRAVERDGVVLYAR